MKRITGIMLLVICLLSMSACKKEPPQLSATVPTEIPETAPTAEPVAESAESAGPRLLERPENGKVCVGFLPTEAGSWRYVVIEDQEAAAAAYKKAAGSIYSDEWWIKGDRTAGLMVAADGQFWDFVESRELVYALGRVKVEDAADLYALCAAAAKEAGWKAHVSPEQLTDLVRATLRQGEKTVTLSDVDALEKLEAMLSAGTYELGGTGCPFNMLLEMETESGETHRVALATDSCGVWMSEGYYYSYGTDSQVLYDLFGATLDFGNLQ